MTFQITRYDGYTYIFWDGTEVCVRGGVMPGIIKCYVKKLKVKVKLKGLRLPAFVRPDSNELDNQDAEPCKPYRLSQPRPFFYPTGGYVIGEFRR